MPHKKEPPDLIGRIYDCALDPRAWPNVLEEIAKSFDSVCCYVFVGDRSRDQIFFSAINKRFTMERSIEYHAHYRHIDDRLLLSFRRPNAKVYADWELIDPEDFVKTEFYNDFYAPHGLRWSAVGMPIHEDCMSMGFSLHRPPGAEGFVRSELKQVQLLFPHLARACRLMRQTAEVGSLAAAGVAALDRLNVGICMLDPSGRPLFVNRAARQVMDQADGLGISRHGLLASRMDETNALRRAIDLAATQESVASVDAGGTLIISRPSGKRPYQVKVTPLRSGHESPFLAQKQAAALVTVVDPESEPAPASEVLAQIFGFTPAEARLAVRLMQGQSLMEIADSTRRTVNTVRWILRNVLAKADCHRQIDLMRLLRSVTLIQLLDEEPSDRSDD